MPGETYVDALASKQTPSRPRTKPKVHFNGSVMTYPIDNPYDRTSEVGIPIERGRFRPNQCRQVTWVDASSNFLSRRRRAVNSLSTTVMKPIYEPITVDLTADFLPESEPKYETLSKYERPAAKQLIIPLKLIKLSEKRPSHLSRKSCNIPMAYDWLLNLPWLYEPHYTDVVPDYYYQDHVISRCESPYSFVSNSNEYSEGTTTAAAAPSITEISGINNNASNAQQTSSKREIKYFANLNHLNSKNDQVLRKYSLNLPHYHFNKPNEASTVPTLRWSDNNLTYLTSSLPNIIRHRPLPIRIQSYGHYYSISLPRYESNFPSYEINKWHSVNNSSSSLQPALLPFYLNSFRSYLKSFMDITQSESMINHGLNNSFTVKELKLEPECSISEIDCPTMKQLNKDFNCSLPACICNSSYSHSNTNNGNIHNTSLSIPPLPPAPYLEHFDRLSDAYATSKSRFRLSQQDITRSASIRVINLCKLNNIQEYDTPGSKLNHFFILYFLNQLVHLL